MDKDNSRVEFQIPSFARKEIYDFDTTKETFEIYRELSQIAEEIEECRNRNS